MTRAPAVFVRLRGKIPSTPIYSVASTSYQVFQIATGKEEMPTAREMGSAIVMNLLFRGAGKFAAKQFDKVKGFFKSRNGERVAADCLDNSFLADTLVDTARGYINIQDVEVGDLLWSFSEDSERTELKEVVHLIKGEGERNIVVLTLSTEDKLQATDGHLLYLAGEKLWKKASEIDTGDELLDRYGNFVQVVDIEQYSDSLLVYNLTVEDYHTYYVSKSSVLSHNCGFVGKNVLETLTKNTTSNPVKRGKQYSGKTGGMTQAESEFELMISRYGIKPNSRMTLPKGGTKVQLLDGSFMTLERGGSGATIYLKVDGKQHKIRYEQ